MYEKLEENNWVVWLGREGGYWKSKSGSRISVVELGEEGSQFLL